MSNQEFIKDIARYVQEYAPKYGISVCSPIIAQACKESGFGRAKSISGICKADYHNYFGLKYRNNRVTCHNGTFVDGSKEERNGNLVPITDQWYSFADMAHGVEGYFQFINTSNYKNVKGITDPREYLHLLCEVDHYCTSTTYVDSCMKDYIEKYNLTQYDPTPVQNKLYRVQIGAYKNKANADAMIKRLKLDGIDSIIKVTDGLYKAQVGAYKNKANAESMMEYVKSKGYNAIVVYG